MEFVLQEVTHNIYGDKIICSVHSAQQKHKRSLTTNASPNKSFNDLMVKFSVSKAMQKSRYGTMLLLLVSVVSVVMCTVFPESTKSIYNKPIRTWTYECEYCSLPVLVIIIGSTMFLSMFFKISKESVVIIPAFGLQITQKSVLNHKVKVRLVPSVNIKSVVIVETIKQQRVVSYLAVILKTEDSANRTIVPLFTETLPRLKTIETMYRIIQASLFS